MTQTPEHRTALGRLRRWPTDPAALVDTTRCPACLTPLRSAVCDECGLDLRATQSTELLASGRRILAEEQRRQRLLDEMFAEQERATHAAQPVGQPVAVTAATATETGARPAGAATVPPRYVPPTLSTAQTAAPPPYVPPAGSPQTQQPSAASTRRRSGMQVFLLTLGVVLIAVTAIVFLFVAYLIASLEVRSVIIAIASVLVVGVAALLRRRRLTGTAEGVAVVAVVLLLLDVWIVRANDLFGTLALRPTAYTGLALVVLSAALAGAGLATGLRALRISAAVLAPTALFFIGVALAPVGEPGSALWLGGIVALLSGLAAALIRLPRLERVILLALGMTGGVSAWCMAVFALPSLAWHPLLTYAVVAVGWAATLGALAWRGRELGIAWQLVAAVAAGSALALAPTVAVAIELDPLMSAWLAPTCAAALATLLSAGLRFTAPRPRALALGVFGGAGVVAVFASLPAALAGAVQLGTLVVGAFDGWSGRWQSSPSTQGGIAAELTTAAIVVPFVLALASTIALVAARRLTALASIPVSLIGIGLIVGGAAADDLRVAVVVLVATAVAALALAAQRLPVPGLLPVLAIAGPLAAALAWTAGFGSASVWAWSTIIALALTLAGWLLARRIWTERAAAAAVVHALLLAIQVVIASLTVAPWMSALGIPLAAEWRVPTVWAALIAGALFGGAAVLRIPRCARIAFTAPLLAASAIAVTSLLVTNDSSLRWVCALVLAIASAVWTWRVRLTGLTPVAACLAPISLALSAAWVAGDLAGEPAQADASAAAALLVAAALAHLLTRAGSRLDVAARIAWAAGTSALTLIVAVSAAVGEEWLPLILVAPIPIVLAALWGDPVTSTAPMRHVAWASPVLAVAAWWIWLSDTDARAVELFTLPVAALCLVVSVLITARRPIVGRAAGRVTLIAVGLGVAVLPSVAASGESTIRTIVLVAAGAVVLLATAFAPHTVKAVPVGVLGLSAGVTAAVGGAAVHAATAAGSPGAATEWWSVAAFVVGVGAAVWWARSGRTPRRLADAVWAATIVAAAVPTLIAILAGGADDTVAVTRAAILLPLLAALHVVAAGPAPRPFAGALPRWATLAVLVAGAGAACAAQVEPFDLMTASVGLALIGAGIFDLRRRPERGSWAALGPGLVVVLVPTLLADFFDPQLWRIVALGVAALATLLAGIRWRLQAPFLLGGAILLVHAIAQLWPWITWLYEAVWWWLWLGIAGVLLVIIAATYERRLRSARGAVARLAALR